MTAPAQTLLLALSLVLSWALSGLAYGSESASPTLAILLDAPRHYTDADEPEEERWARLEEIADAIDSATKDRATRSALLTLVRHETHAARYVHFDWAPCREGHKGRCDGGRAFGLIQLHGTTRTESLEWQMKRGASLLRFGLRRCGSWRGAFASYATGGSCRWSDRENLERRVRTWRAYMERM